MIKSTIKKRNKQGGETKYETERKESTLGAAKRGMLQSLSKATMVRGGETKR